MNKRVTKSYDREPPGYGTACSRNSDCQNVVLQLECIHSICVCLDGYVPLGKYICYNTRGEGKQLLRNLFEIIAIVFKDKSAVEDSTRISTITSKTSTGHPINNEVIKSLGKIGNTCVNDYFCRRTVSQSHCYNGKCACTDGYISIDQYTCAKSN